jgi:hypothetical protein
MTKKAPQSGGYCGAKGFGLFLGGKKEELCSVVLKPTIMVRYVKKKRFVAYK